MIEFIALSPGKPKKQRFCPIDRDERDCDLPLRQIGLTD